MKRFTALALAALLSASLFAACGRAEKASSTAIGDVNTIAEYDDDVIGLEEISFPVAQIPSGWFAFATIENRKVKVNGFSYLRGALGENVALSSQDKLELSFGKAEEGAAGEIQSILVNGIYVPVLDREVDGKRTLFAESGSSAEDPNLIDLNPAPEVPGTTAVQVPKTKTGSKNKDKVALTVASTKAGATLPTAGTIGTTKKQAEVTTDVFASQKKEVEDSNMKPAEKAAALKFLSYTYDKKNDVFYVEHQPWQKQFGFNAIYDVASPIIQLVYATFRIKFRYGYVYKVYQEGDKKGQVVYDSNNEPVYETNAAGQPIAKDWLIQGWKGRYGVMLLGGEIGIYTKPANQAADHYYSAVSEEELVMAMDCYQHNFKTNTTKHLFTRGPQSEWWLTGFVPGSFVEYNNKKEVIMLANIKFPTQEMQDLFAAGLEKAGFKLGSPSKERPETYVTSGLNLKFSWQFLDEDAGEGKLTSP